MLGYWQVVAADRPQGPRRTTRRPPRRERLVDRGRIISADGKVLAASRAVRVNGPARLRARSTPRASWPPHVVGYSTSDQGRTGVESTYNRYLSGSFGTAAAPAAPEPEAEATAPTSSSASTRRVQRAAERRPRGPARRRSWPSTRRTGAVLAMASAPAFDLQHGRSPTSTRSPAEGGPLLNRATSGPLRARARPSRWSRRRRRSRAAAYTPDLALRRHRLVRHPRRADPQLRRRGLRPHNLTRP